MCNRAAAADQIMMDELRAGWLAVISVATKLHAVCSSRGKIPLKLGTASMWFVAMRRKLCFRRLSLFPLFPATTSKNEL